MSEQSTDLVGQILWFTMLGTPLITIPLAWIFLKVKKFYRVIFGLILALILSFCLYHLSLAFILRHGLGPV